MHSNETLDFDCGGIVPGSTTSSSVESTIHNQDKRINEPSNDELSIADVASTSKASHTSSSIFDISPGVQVEVNWIVKGGWWCATVERINKDGSIMVVFEDGSKDTTHRNNIRAMYDAAKFTESSIVVGSRVESKYLGKDGWWLAVVQNVRRDGTYDVKYDDGTEENFVYRNHIRLINSDNSKSYPVPTYKTSSSNSSATSAQSYPVSTYKTTSAQSYPVSTYKTTSAQSYPVSTNKTSSSNSSATSAQSYPVSTYKTTSAQSYPVPTYKTSSSNSSTTSAQSSVNGKVKFYIGCQVEVRLTSSSSTWNRGTIAHINSDDTFDIDYGGSTKEKGVRRALIRLPSNGAVYNPTTPKKSSAVLSIVSSIFGKKN